MASPVPPIPGPPRTSIFNPSTSTPSGPPKRTLAPTHTPTLPPSPAPLSRASAKPTLLTLPLELRHLILAFILPTSTIGHEHAETQATHAADLQILRTCRQLHAEGLEHYFGRNNLLLRPARAAFSFLRGIGAQRRQLLAEVTLELGACHLTVGCVEALALCMGLRNLSLSMEIAVVRDLLAMGKWGALHGFGAAEIYETVHEGCGAVHLNCAENQERSLVYDSALAQPWVNEPVAGEWEEQEAAELRAVVLLLTAPCVEGCTAHGGRTRLVDRRTASVSISDVLWWR